MSACKKNPDNLDTKRFALLVRDSQITLTFTELESLTSFRTTRFLTLNSTRIASYESFRSQDSLIFRINLYQRTREKLQITRQRAKLEKTLGSIVDLTRLPSALFVVDVMKEHIAVREANRLGIPVFGMVDTNSNPNNIDYVIPANDDATKSVEVPLQTL